MRCLRWSSLPSFIGISLYSVHRSLFHRQSKKPLNLSFAVAKCAYVPSSIAWFLLIAYFPFELQMRLPDYWGISVQFSRRPIAMLLSQVLSWRSVEYSHGWRSALSINFCKSLQKRTIWISSLCVCMRFCLSVRLSAWWFQPGNEFWQLRILTMWCTS